MSQQASLTILFYSYPSLLLRTGGLQNQMFATKFALERLGHRVLLFEEWVNQESRCEIDIYHQFSCHPATIQLFELFKASGKPIIISTVFNYPKTWMNTLVSMCCKIGVPLFNHRSVKRIMRRADHLVSLGKLETTTVLSYSGTNVNISTIPNGVNESVLQFDNSNQCKEDYVVVIGKICSGKNTLVALEVCAELGLDVVVIGPESTTETEYVRKCKAVSDRIRFTGFIDNESAEFHKLVASAKLLLMPSLNEVLPLSAFEALILGTPVVCTKNSSIGTYLGPEDGCLLCNPQDKRDIKAATTLMYGKQISPSQIAQLKERFNWNRIAQDLEKIYNNLTT